MAAGDKSHLYAAAGLPVNTYVPSGLLQGELGSAMGFSNAAQNSNTSATLNLDHPAASGQAGLFYDDGIDWANPDLTYDIPADDMQANYEYEAYGGPRGPDWVFNPNVTTPTSEPNRTPTTNPDLALQPNVWPQIQNHAVPWLALRLDASGLIWH